MTANSTPESFDAVLAELPASFGMVAVDGSLSCPACDAISTRLQSAHARELAEQQATHAAEVGELRKGIVQREDDVILPRHLYEEINRVSTEWEARAEQDARRLDFVLRRMQGAGLRSLVGVLSDTSDMTEFRAAIDACMGATREQRDPREQENCNVR